MKKQISRWMILFAVMTGVLGTPVISYGEGTTGSTEEAINQAAQVAGEGETVEAQTVGEEGMIPVYGTDIQNGVYSVEAESSSSMFRIVKAELTVADGNMTAVITLSGKGYSKLYMGTGLQAVEAEESAYISFVEDEEGAYTYTIPVEALNQPLECAAFSKKKEKWYDRQILFRADTIPQDALLKALTPAFMDAKDGTYTMEVGFAGGSGKASITSPAVVTITENTGIASIQWSSPNYDYMIVNGEKLLPVNTEGNSVFEVPVWVLDQEMTVIADTTAMSTPHEVEYTLTFYSDTLKAEGNTTMIILGIAGALVVAGVIGAVIVIRKKKNGHHA